MSPQTLQTLETQEKLNQHNNKDKQDRGRYFGSSYMFVVLCGRVSCVLFAVVFLRYVCFICVSFPWENKQNELNTTKTGLRGWRFVVVFCLYVFGCSGVFAPGLIHAFMGYLCFQCLFCFVIVSHVPVFA